MSLCFVNWAYICPSIVSQRGVARDKTSPAILGDVQLETGQPLSLRANYSDIKTVAGNQ